MKTTKAMARAKVKTRAKATIRERARVEAKATELLPGHVVFDILLARRIDAAFPLDWVAQLLNVTGQALRTALTITLVSIVARQSETQQELVEHSTEGDAYSARIVSVATRVPLVHIRPLVVAGHMLVCRPDGP